MKLIIDIADEDYNNIEPFLDGQTIKGGFNIFKVLEMIKNGVPWDQPVPFNDVKIDTLRFERYFSKELILGNWNNGSYLRRAIADNFADCLTDNLEKYVKYFTEFCPNLDKYRFVGEVKIVEREVEK